jgi:hypothetical protein
MNTITRLPLMLVALGAAAPAMAHDAGFLHTHGEGIAAAATAALVLGGALVCKRLASRARK